MIFFDSSPIFPSNCDWTRLAVKNLMLFFDSSPILSINFAINFWYFPHFGAPLRFVTGDVAVMIFSY